MHPHARPAAWCPQGAFGVLKPLVHIFLSKEIKPMCWVNQKKTARTTNNATNQLNSFYSSLDVPVLPSFSMATASVQVGSRAFATSHDELDRGWKHPAGEFGIFFVYVCIGCIMIYIYIICIYIYRITEVSMFESWEESDPPKKTILRYVPLD